MNLRALAGRLVSVLLKELGVPASVSSAIGELVEPTSIFAEGLLAKGYDPVAELQTAMAVIETSVREREKVKRAEEIAAADRAEIAKFGEEP